jgi:hypothetical protein
MYITVFYLEETMKLSSETPWKLLSFRAFTALNLHYDAHGYDSI